MARDTALTPSIMEEATHWWVVFNTDEASPADHQEFAAWIARSPERVEAYLRMAQLDHTLKASKIKWPATSAELLVSEARTFPRDEFEVRRDQTAFVPERSRSWFTPLRLASGFAAACLIAAGSIWFMFARPVELQTKLGEQRSVQLQDGSHLTLNSATKAEIEMLKGRRLVRLLWGEALFEVNHDPSRPFEVVTERAALKDVGTQFDVDVRADHTAITVIEGRVEVMPSNGLQSAGGPRPILSAADQLVIGPTGIGMLQRDVNVRDAIAWTQHRLIFERRPLREVAAEFNRYNADQIRIESAELGDQTITGVFASNGVRSFVSFLAGIPGVQVRDDRDGNHVVTVDGRASTSK
jgi:transmembrane sensor